MEAPTMIVAKKASFAIYKIIGQFPGEREIIGQMNAFVRPDDQEPLKITGCWWSGGLHVFDNQITHGKNLFNNHLAVAAVIEKNEVPGKLVKAWKSKEEEEIAKSNPSGFISRAQRLEVRRRCAEWKENEVKSGKHRKYNLVPIIINLRHGLVYTSPSASVSELINQLFSETLAGGPMLERHSFAKMTSPEAIEKLRPTYFGLEDVLVPTYPWVTRTREQCGWIGAEFLTWLWYSACTQKNLSSCRVSPGDKLLMDCSMGQNGSDAIKGISIEESPEAKEAFRNGKVVRQIHMFIEDGLSAYEALILDDLTVQRLDLVSKEEDSIDNGRDIVESRLNKLEDFRKALSKLFADYFVIRSSGNWKTVVESMKEW